MDGDGDVTMEISAIAGALLSNTMPSPEATAASAGSMDQASRADHTHPRRSSTATGTLNSSGEATITFTQTFAAKPAVTVLYVEGADNQPIVFKVKSWTMVSGQYTGCVIKGYRAQAIPTNLVSLLLGGVFNLFAGSASGVEYALIAIAPSS